MIAWFARNHVTANLLLCGIVIGGLYSLFTQLNLDLFPIIEPQVIKVVVPLRGATPEDIELGVAIRIEEAVQDLEGVSQIISRSREGRAEINIEIDSDYVPRELLSDIKNRVDSINTFPADTEKPVISLTQRIRPVLSVVVAGVHAENEVRDFAEQVRADMLRLEGVTQVQLDAVRKYEISIEASQHRLREYGLNLADIAHAIQRSSLDISAGNVRTQAGNVLIRSKGQAYRRVEFENIVVKTSAQGSIIRVGDVATVNDGFEEVALRTGFNGEYAAMIQVYRVGDQDAIEIADKVKDYIANKADSLPAGMFMDYWRDRSSYLKARLGTLVSNGIQGGILVIILLSLFLRPAVAFWVFIGIPVSFLGVLMVMPLTGVTINMVSLFGFIIVLGLVVDDAIVTGENIYTRLREGGDPLTASITGARQVAVPVTFGVLTTIAAFSPLAFVEGRMGDFMGAVPAVVIPCLLFSMIESKLVLPAHLKTIKLNNGSPERGLSRFQRRFADGFEASIIRYYRPLLHYCLHNRYSVVAVFLGALVLTLSLVFSGWAKFVFFPRVESDVGTATLTMPVGAPFAVTDTHIQRITDAAFELKAKYTNGPGGEPLIRDILSTTGSARTLGNGDQYGQVVFEAVPSDERRVRISTYDLLREWRRMIGGVPGAESLTFRAELINTGDPINIQLSSPSLDDLEQVAAVVKQRLTTYPAVFDIVDSLSDGKEELRIELTPQGHLLGLTRAAIANQVSQAFRGFEAQRIQRGRDDVRVIVRLPQAERSVTDTLDEYLIRTPDGRAAPLSHVAVLEPGQSPAVIKRIDRYRTVNVVADVDKQSVNMKVLLGDLEAYLQALLPNYPGLAYTLEGEAREQRLSFQSLYFGIAVLLFLVYALLALPLKSYIQPLVVMSVIPFGIIGAIWGHWIMGRDLTFSSMLGLMALIGVVVNDSLVLVDFINQRRAQGLGLYEAVAQAGVARFRPVLLTSLTTFLGLLPLLFEKSLQAQFLIPMAVSLGFGILFATLITLLMVPANILLLADLQRLLKIGGAAPARQPARL